MFVAHPFGLVRKHLAPTADYPPRAAPFHGGQRWDYSKAMYKKRNEVERLFRRLKGFRRIFSRFDKLDCVFMFFIHFALITDAIISVNTP